MQVNLQQHPTPNEVKCEDYSHISSHLIGESLLSLLSCPKNITSYIIPEHSTNVKEYKCYKTIEELHEDIPDFKSCHWGQRKLLLTEILFLSLCIPTLQFLSKKIQVIYVGAAPCDHIYALCEMFPNCYFHLIDPASWNHHFTKQVPSLKTIKKRDEPITIHKMNDINCTVYHGYFTDEYAETFANDYKEQQILFISDIRPIDTDTASEGDYIKREGVICNDMELQKKWFTTLHDKNNHPEDVWCMLKFKATYEVQLTRYLNGLLFLQPWTPLLSNECRMITNQTATRDYDCHYFEGFLNYHNKITRNKEFRPRHPNCNSIFDTQYEYDIIKLYLERVATVEWKRQYNILDICFWLSKQLGSRSSYNKECYKYTFQKGYVPPAFLKAKWINKIVSLNNSYASE